MVRNTLRLINKNKKVVVVVACLAIIVTAVYVDWRIGGSDPKNSEYLYTSEISDSSKILGEAKFVDNKKDTTKKSLDASKDVSTDNYFSSAQINRKRSRDESVEMLQTVVDSSESMPDVKDKALKDMMTIASDIEKEATVEEMVKAKGFKDCIAVITGENINVVVKTPGLLANEVAQIREIIMNETGFTADKIKIVEKS